MKKVKKQVERVNEDKSRETELLLLAHLDSLYNAALRLSRSPSDAEDLVQETYYKAFRYFDQLREMSSIRTWLFHILKNTYINSYWKKQKDPDTVDIDNLEITMDYVGDEQYSFLANLDDYKLKTVFHDEVKLALDKLPYDYKLCIILRDIEGFSYKEIAEIVGDPLGTIMSRLHRARKILYLQLLDYAHKHGYIQ
ncbi:sigma-70 family RNA polymerase sigma factor [bacterium]|nr:sigma-70 family RNA polymerase sigma factor [bacterium]